MNNNKAKLLLILVMFIFGTIGIFRKYIPLPSSLIALTRGFIGMVFLLLVVFLRKDQMDWDGIKKNFFLLFLSGVFIGFNWIFLFEAYRYTTIATATICYYMAPVLVILVAPIFFREKLTKKKLICVFISFIGMALVSGILETGFAGASELKGVFFGLSAAVFYAGVIVLNKSIKEIPAYDKTIVQLGAAAITLLPYTLLTENLTELTFTPMVIVMLLIVGILHTGIAYAIYFGTIEKLNAQTIGLFSYFDPVVAILLSGILLRENIGVSGAIGAVLVLGAALVSELPERKKEVAT
ncbi:MAG: DMT family transporter [Desulfitobacterium sp.]|nr:DMT family transporter [Desulfitobacterium sp.]